MFLKVLSSCINKGSSLRRAESIQHTKVRHGTYWYIKVSTRVQLLKGAKQKMAMKFSEYISQREAFKSSLKKRSTPEKWSRSKYELRIPCTTRYYWNYIEIQGSHHKQGQITHFVETCYSKEIEEATQIRGRKGKGGRII